MAVEIIENFSINAANGVCASVDLDDLYLDDLNPRFSASLSFSEPQAVDQKWIINYLLVNSSVIELTKSINIIHGLYDEELISAFYNSEKS